MSTDIIISTILGLSTLLFSLLSQAELWQRKEYRFDRVLSYIKDSTRTLVKRHLLVIGIITIGLAWFLFLGRLTGFATYLGWVALLCLMIDHAQRIKARGIFRPKPTLKVSLLLLLAMLLVILYFINTFEPLLVPALQWATLIFFLPLIMVVAVFLVNIPANIRKQQIINKAKSLRNKLPDLKVIGITGSVGKTSTKHFLKHILEGTKYNVAATKEHRNSEIVVAIDMLEQLSSDTDIYIAEMAAYCVGEVKALAELAKPQIGILTAIGNQHLSLFGSRENILQAKWELVDGLPNNGQVILNADDVLLKDRGETTEKAVHWYSMKEEAEVYATSIKEKPTSIAFTLHIGDKKKTIESPIVSKGMLSSLLAAVTAAYTLGVESDIIFNQVKTVTSYDQTMKVMDGKAKATIIDDSYSTSENSVHNAIDHLRTFKNKDKRIVFVPILELGSEATDVHEKIGRLLAETNATVYIYGEDYQESLQKGIDLSNKKAHIEWVIDPLQLKEMIAKNITSDTVILLEGRVATVIRQALLS